MISRKRFLQYLFCLVHRCTHCEQCNTCIPRRRAHCNLFGKCIGYFNHRYYFVGCVYCLFYSANAVTVSVIFYARMLRNCALADNFPPCEDYEDCHLMLTFFISALWNFFVLIFFIILLTLESEIIINGRMRHEIDTQNYDRGIRKNLICVLGRRWYLACLCPMAESVLPEMHAVLFRVGERPLSFASTSE